MHRFKPLASYRYDTALVGPDKIILPPAALRIGELIRDEELGYYLYQMSFQNRMGLPQRLEGVFGILEIVGRTADALEFEANESSYGPDHILVHEQTIGPKSPVITADLDTLIARPGTGPIWAISAQSKLQAQEIPRGPSLESVVDGSGVTHQVWHLVEKEQLNRIRSAVETSQLIIADGHHRIARAMRLLSGSPPESTVRLLCFVTDLDPLQAEIRPIHRCFKTRLNEEDVLKRLTERFRVDPYEHPDLSNGHVADALLLVLRQKVFKVMPIHEDPKLNDAVLSQTIAKLLEAKSTQYITDIQKLHDKVLSDPTKVGLVTRPLTINQIRIAAFGRNPLPPKSTMFYPKPLPGLIFGDKLNL